jgi:hypothetical protein
MRPLSAVNCLDPPHEWAQGEFSTPTGRPNKTSLHLQGMGNRSFMRSAHDTESPKRLPSTAWLAVLVVSAAIIAYGTFVVLNLVGLR